MFYIWGNQQTFPEPNQVPIQSKLALSDVAGGSVKWYSHFAKLAGGLRQLNVHVSVSQPFQSGIYLHRNKTTGPYKALCTNADSILSSPKTANVSVH